jgi:hypothetical protein
MQNRLSMYLMEEGQDFVHPADCKRSKNILAANLPSLFEENHPQIEFSRSSSAARADFVLFPYTLDDIFDKYGFIGINRFVSQLSHFTGTARKTVFFFGNDLAIPFEFPSILIRTSASRKIPGSNTIAFPYPISKVPGEMHFSPEKIGYDTSFVGYIGSSAVRFAVLKSFYEVSHRMRCFIDVVNVFHAHGANADSRSIRRKLFLDSIPNSWTILCPRGSGMNSIRFFEVLALGRIPVLISDDCMLPWESKINYSGAIIVVPENKIGETPELLQEWFGTKSPAQILEQCQYCHSLWRANFSSSVLPWRLLDELLEHKRQHGATLNEPFDGILNLADDQRVIAQLKAEFDHLISQDDDVNALSVLINLKAFTPPESAEAGNIDKSLTELRYIISTKSELYLNYLKNAPQGFRKESRPVSI